MCVSIFTVNCIVLCYYNVIFCISRDRERTFIIIKPDGVQRGAIGKIISRFEEKGFKLVAMKFMHATDEILNKHYEELKSRPFFPTLINYMTSGPIVLMVWEGLNAVKVCRILIGVTNPADGAPGTIRGDFGLIAGRNLIHGSDSVENAKREIELWFDTKEIMHWKSAMENWVYED